MQDVPISGFPEASFTLDTDTLHFVRDGENYRVPASLLRDALPVASTSQKGLMSSSDKNTLNTATQNITSLRGEASANIVATSTVVVPEGVKNIYFVGATPITNIASASAGNRSYFVHAGSGTVTVLGVPLSVGDTPLHVVVAES
jgi:hypothetical protein